MARPATGNVRARQLANGDTRYALRFRVNGEPVYETLGTDAEGWDFKRAEERLRDRLAEVRLGTYVPPPPAARAADSAADPTFHEFASRWFAMVEPEQKDPAALRWRLTHVLLPFFQHHRLTDITVAEVDRYRAAKVQERDLLRAAREAGEKIPRRPLSNSTINRTIGLLAQILDLAQEYGYIEGNPARGRRRKLKAQRPQRPYLDSAAQIVALLDAAGELDRGSRADRRHVNRRAQLATLIFAGLRISEFVDIRWSDVDLAGGWLTVGESKTDAGRRKVKVRPVLRDVLLELRAATDPHPAAFVFGTATGKQQNPSNVRNRVLTRSVQRATERLQEAGEAPLPALTPHGLRRSFASLLYGIGEPPPVVMQELGHTDPALALSIDAHAMRRDDGENERLKALVEGAAMEGLWTGPHSEGDSSTPVKLSVEGESRS
jgi:integrase